MAQDVQFPLKKPPGFHYDFFLLGICTFTAGLIGVPAPNGLIPQAPIHTTSLLVMQHSNQKNNIREESTEIEQGKVKDITHGAPDPDYHEVPVGVVEQRASNLAQGALCLVLLTGPFLHVLHLIPRGKFVLCRVPYNDISFPGVLAGLLYVPILVLFGFI